MDDAGEIERFYDRCSDLMRELLDALAAAPDHPRAFAEIEDALSWPRRRIASVLGGVWHLRTVEFGGRRPYRFLDRAPVGIRSLGDVDEQHRSAGNPYSEAPIAWPGRTAPPSSVRPWFDERSCSESFPFDQLRNRRVDNPPLVRRVVAAGQIPSTALSPATAMPRTTPGAARRTAAAARLRLEASSSVVFASVPAARRVAILSGSCTWSLSASPRRMRASATFTAAPSAGGHSPSTRRPSAVGRNEDHSSESWSRTGRVPPRARAAAVA